MDCCHCELTVGQTIFTQGVFLLAAKSNVGSNIACPVGRDVFQYPCYNHVLDVYYMSYNVIIWSKIKRSSVIM